MATLHSVMEYQFVDPRTIRDGVDVRGWEIDQLFTAAAPPTTATPFGTIEEFAARQEKYAAWCEQEMRAYGRIDSRHTTVHMDLGDVPTKAHPCPRCAEIAADARACTRTAERSVLARIRVPGC